MGGKRHALGLMSGTSLDGIDIASIETDGLAQIVAGPAQTFPYDDALRVRLRAVLGGVGAVAEVEAELTEAHAKAVLGFVRQHRLKDVHIVGFHGHTILHKPEEGRTWQIGDGAKLAAAIGFDVVCDFRSADVAAGGEGAPFAPLYHAGLAAAAKLETPLAVLNLGGVANVTWLGGERILAFDTGPGNALLDDWALRHTGKPVDLGGVLAKAGQVDEDFVARFLEHDFFARLPPKSLDRNEFAHFEPGHLGPEDGAATLVAMTAESVARAVRHLPVAPKRWLVTGGGRHNPVLMRALHLALATPVEKVEAVGWDGDAMEAQAFAYLAVRSLEGLPLSLPSTTGVKEPLTGGRHHRAGRR